MNKEIYNKLCKIIDASDILADEPMKKHTTFRIGGNADFFLMPRKAEEVIELIMLCIKEKIPYYILGNGSNLLVSDKGYRGVIIQLYKNFNNIEVKGDIIKVQAGALLSRIAREAAEHELKGFEFAGGIPGTIGGAVVMNAGAYGGELKDVIEKAVVYAPGKGVLHLDREALELGYRTSIVSKEHYIVLEAVLSLEKGKLADIQEQMETLKHKRLEKQPLEFPSAGSTFKRPAGYFAGKLIMDAGLKGAQIGDAVVSEKHCGFVINKGNATAGQVLQLIGHVIETVKNKFGVELETEVKMLGDFSD